jgi:hypothetical protein
LPLRTLLAMLLAAARTMPHTNINQQLALPPPPPHHPATPPHAIYTGIWHLASGIQVRRPVFQRIFWDLGPGHKPDISLKKYKTAIKLLVAAAVGRWVPGCQKLSFCVFLRRNPPQTPPARTATQCWHHTALVVLPVSSLAAFGKSPAARGSRNGPRTPPKRRSAAGTALGRNWGALP